MRTCTLRPSGLEVSALGPGCWAIGGHPGPGRTPAEGTVGWLGSLSEKTIPLPGFRTTAQVEENAAALACPLLTADEMQQIKTLLGQA